MSRVADIDIVQRRLEYPLSADAVYWRIGQTSRAETWAQGGGKPWATCLAYVDARAVRRRLTEVLGLDGWQTRMERFADPTAPSAAPATKEDKRDRAESGFICTLRCRLAGEWVERADTSDDTEQEAVKGGASKALVRAAANFGVGEYLYGLGRSYAEIVPDRTAGSHWQAPSAKAGTPAFSWLAPALPAWALPVPIAQEELAALLAEAAKHGQEVADVAEWCLDRYGVPLEALEGFLAADAVDWWRDRSRGAAGEERNP